MGQNLYNSSTTPVAYDRALKNNVTIITVAFGYPHKVHLPELQSISSDPTFAFNIQVITPHILLGKLMSIICREMFAANQAIDYYDCEDNYPCTLENWRKNPTGTFAHKQHNKFVKCSGLTQCRVDECQQSSSWNNDTKVCES
ncbi:hypothetical protein HELRODRAFT_171801 [Helobdella robusta]|uniref:Uncharacterized protein n=1 Tax=Helobdella robusta TaxID=6412 RepID=T1F4P4_HELRO|nr:hypothetical protein HELRODRAFT_171801 [Helobdella robusta]ESO05403.1 hypothetical protein HELRODRAFT_171801 [Helobdella robusta]